MKRQSFFKLLLAALLLPAFVMTLAAAGEPNGDGSPRFSAGFQFGNERGDACNHFVLVPFLFAAAFFGTSRRTSPVTEGASVFLNSPACLP